MPRVTEHELARFVRGLLESLGAAATVADAVSDSLVTADLRGHPSHGVRLLPGKYAREIRDGGIDLDAEPAVVTDDGVFSIIDGRRAFGHVVARRALDVAFDTADRHGIAAVGVRNTSHIGRVGEWAERACDRGFGLLASVSNPGSSWVTPPGSTERRLSTNPIAIGLPTFGVLDFPVVLDAATSQVARGKIGLLASEGEMIPDGWLVDDEGEAVTRPEAYEQGEGALLPLGGFEAGHKGFGLAVMNELLAANLSDWFVSGQPDAPHGNVAAFLVVDLTRVSSARSIGERARAMGEHIRSTASDHGVPTPAAIYGDEALLPGEAEHRIEAVQRRDGIALAATDARSLADLARELEPPVEVPPALR